MPAVTLASSRCTLPSAPSAQISTRGLRAAWLAVGHASASCAHVLVGSPVAGDHLSENEEKGPHGGERAARRHREGRFEAATAEWEEPPPAHEYSGTEAPEAKETRKPVYSGVLLRTARTRSPLAALDASAKEPCARGRQSRWGRARIGGDGKAWVGREAHVCRRFDEPRRTERRHVTTSPSNTPTPPATFHVPVERPPITGSLSSLKSKVVPFAPSNVTSGTLAADGAGALTKEGDRRASMWLWTFGKNRACEVEIPPLSESPTSREPLWEVYPR